MTPNTLLYCEKCKHYTQHVFVMNIGECKICIDEKLACVERRIGEDYENQVMTICKEYEEGVEQIPKT